MPQSPQPNQTTKELQAMLAAALTVPEESLPDFLAELERVRDGRMDKAYASGTH